MSRHTLAILAIFFASIFWGVSSVVMKLTLKTIPPFSLLFLRFFIASLIIFPFFIKMRRKFQNDLSKLFLFCLLPFLNVVLFIIGLKWTAASVSTVLYGLSPILVVLFLSYFLKEKISLFKILGIIIGFLGVLLIAMIPVLTKDSFLGQVKGNLIILLAVFLFSLYTVFLKVFLEKYSAIILNSLFFFLTMVFTFPLFVWEMGRSNLIQEISGFALLGCLYLGLFCTVGTFFLYQYGVKNSSPLEATLTFYLQPIIGSLAAWLVLKEKLSALFFLGLGMTLFGVFLTTTYGYLKNKSVIK